MDVTKGVRGGSAAIIALLLVLSAPAADPPAKPKETWKSLFDGKSIAGWKTADFRGGGRAEVKDGAIVIEKGSTMSGVAYTGGDFPKVDYEVSFEGKRIAGGDFFCTTIFPVDSDFCSFVAGGWGGTIVGLSNVNSENASANVTTKHKEFDNEKWYRFRLRVTKDRIRTWIGDDQVVDIDTTENRIGLHGACEPCKPFGFATWKTTGAVRAVRVRQLTEAEKKPADEKDK